MKKWDYLQLELTVIRCIFKRQWMLHLWYKTDMLHFTHLWRTPVSNTQVRQCLCRAVPMNPSLHGKRVHVSVAHWQCTTETKAKCHPAFWWREKNYKFTVQLWNEGNLHFEFLPFPCRSLSCRNLHTRTQHNKSRLCTSLIFPLMLSRQLTVRVRALAEEQMDTAHQKIRDELFIYCP